MAVPRKGWRKIVVRNADYYWRANGNDHGIDVIVVTEAAFERGQKGQQLLFCLDYDHHKVPFKTPHGEGTQLWQQAAISPGVIARALEIALSLKPAFTGEPGHDDMVLPKKAVKELQESAHRSAQPTPV